MTTQIMVDTIQRLVSFYCKDKFRVKEILVNDQFPSSWTALADLQINLNCVSMDEHVPEAKKLIGTLNERCHCSLHNTLFPKLPKHIFIGLLQNVTVYLNAFPHVHGVPTLASLTIVQGLSKTTIYHETMGAVGSQ